MSLAWATPPSARTAEQLIENPPERLKYADSGQRLSHAVRYDTGAESESCKATAGAGTDGDASDTEGTDQLEYAWNAMAKGWDVCVCVTVWVWLEVSVWLGVCDCVCVELATAEVVDEKEGVPKAD